MAYPYGAAPTYAGMPTTRVTAQPAAPMYSAAPATTYMRSQAPAPVTYMQPAPAPAFRVAPAPAPIIYTQPATYPSAPAPITYRSGAALPISSASTASIISSRSAGSPTVASPIIRSVGSPTSSVVVTSPRIISSRGAAPATVNSSRVIQSVQSIPPVKQGADAHRFAKLQAAATYSAVAVGGLAREAFINRVVPHVGRMQDDVTEAYASREMFQPWMNDFFHQHMFRLGMDCWGRVIASSPEASVDVVKRVRPTPGRVRGKILEPLYDLALTDEIQRCLNLSSYNYLGFGGIDEFCTPAARDAAIRHTFSPGAPRSEGGTLPIHRELEDYVAKFLDKEDSVVIGMGFATNSTILPALIAGAGGNCKGVLVLSDTLNHKSIIEGVRLSGGTPKPFEHNNMEALEALLKKAVEDGQPDGTPYRKIFIVIEGIYSMEGEFCRLREIVTLKNRYKAYIYLDEAHSIGAVGPRGRGVTDLLGVPTSEIEVMMGTFTKSFGSAGGYIASTKEVIDSLRMCAPGSVWASAMSAPCAAQALAAFKLIKGEIGGSTGAKKLASIKHNGNYFRKRLQEAGFVTLGDVDSPVIPVMLYQPKKMVSFSRDCLDAGIAIVIVDWPAVPKLEGRARFCISAAHTEEELDKAATKIAEIGKKLGVLYEKPGYRSSLKEMVGLKPRASKTEQQHVEYANWLRTCPMELKGAGPVAPEAEQWTPEPLAPAISDDVLCQLGENGALAKDTLYSVTTAEDRENPLDVRRLDPLGYASHPLQAAEEQITAAMEVYGFGACGPRGFYGTSKLHLELEGSIASFLGTDDAIQYSAGVACASSVLPAVFGAGDHVIVDEEVNLGLRTGLRLSKEPNMYWFPHCDMNGLEQALAQATAAIEEANQDPKKKKEKGPPTRIFIVSEGIFQRTGRIPPLEQILQLKDQYGAYLVLDESLSLGTLGATGRGLAEHCNVEGDRIDAVIGSLEYAIAGVGGFCAGRKSIVEHQRLDGAGYCFSACCPPSACAAAMAMLQDIDAEGGRARLQGMQANAAFLHEALRACEQELQERGIPLTLMSSEGSFMQHFRWMGDANQGATALSAVAKQCERKNAKVQICSPLVCATEGFLNARIAAPPPPPPTVRFCASAAQSPEHLSNVVQIFTEACLQ